MATSSPPGRAGATHARKTSARAALLLIAAAAALPSPARATPQAQAHYAGYVLGLHVFDMTLAVSLQPAAYEMDASFRLAGALGAVWHAEGSTSVHGQFSGGQAVPQEMVSTGRYWGTTHRLRMDWKEGSPDIVHMEPPLENDREKVPQSAQANTVDTLSAVAALLRRVAETGSCDTTARTFDGSRLSELSAQTEGREFLGPSGQSSFQGEALRCGLTVRMTGGFLRGYDGAQAHRPKTATVWFARITKESPPIPVRMAFHAEGSPGATAYLQ